MRIATLPKLLLSKIQIDQDLNMGVYKVVSPSVVTDSVITDEVKVNAVVEKSTGNGVIVDGVVCKDGIAVFGA